MKTITYDQNPSVAAFMMRAFWPSRGFKSIKNLPHFEIYQRNFKFTQDLCSKMHKLTQIPYSETLPIFFPQAMSFRLVMRTVTDPDFPEPIWNALQLRNEINQFYPLRVNDTVSFSLKTHSYRFLEKGVEADFITEARRDGVLCWQNITTFYYRIKHGRTIEAPVKLPPVISSPPTYIFKMPSDGGLKFGNLTGDYNGIHLYRPYARMLGYKSAFLHPHRVVGAALAHIPISVNYPCGVDLWFRGPVSYEATARLAVEKQNNQTCFALYADDERPSVLGRIR